MEVLIIGSVVFAIICVAAFLIFNEYKKTIQEAKNYERGLKMVPMKIHLPPPSDDVDAGSRDERDVIDEVLSEAQTMYNIIASTATKGFKTKLYGQRHISFEIVASDGLINYYAVVPAVITDTVRQAISAAYPNARLEEVEIKNIFSRQGKMQGVIGGEFTLKKDYIYPIATYKESQRDAMRAIIDSLNNVSRGDGASIQVMIRPAEEKWTAKSMQKSSEILNKGSGAKNSAAKGALDIMEALWKPPTYGEGEKVEAHQLSALEREEIEAIENKTKYPGYEVLIRVVVSSSTSAKSQAILNGIVSSFSLFDSPRFNGFKFNMTQNIDNFITSYIFRFFPQNAKSVILNSVELSTIFHLPDRNSISTEKVERQRIKQVDGPTEVMDSGLLLGVNEYRGVEKQIRLSKNDRRRHAYIIGQTGMGKSKLLENLAFQDIMNGDGFAFIDPHGDSVEELLGMIPRERLDDVIYFNPGDTENPLGFNMFEAKSESEMDFIIGETNSMLKSLYDPGNTGVVGPRMENIVRNAAILLMSDPNGGTFMDIPKVLVDPEFAKSKIKYLRNQRAIDFWTKEWPASQRSSEAGELVSWVVSKWAPFENGLLNNILGQINSSFNIRDIMDNQKILLVNLSKGKMGEGAAKLLGMVFVMKFQAAAMSRVDTPEDQRKDFCLYVDEFQNFATDSFESILSEARKFRLNLILANQFMTQLTENIKGAVMGNVPTKLVGRIGIDDAEVLQRAFHPTFTAEDLIKTPNYNAIATVLVNGFPSSPFNIKLLPPLGKSNPQLREAIKQYSASKYGRPKALVEAEIRDRLSVARNEVNGSSVEPSIKKAPFNQSDNNNSLSERREVVENNLNTVSQAKAEQLNQQPSFLDDWLKRREQIRAQSSPKESLVADTAKQGSAPDSNANNNELNIRGNIPEEDEVVFKIR
ncbi:MAG: ATP-binding protein [bacterium]|nr:ATP-binding protein [bacterium]